MKFLVFLALWIGIEIVGITTMTVGEHFGVGTYRPGKSADFATMILLGWLWVHAKREDTP